MMPIIEYVQNFFLESSFNFEAFADFIQLSWVIALDGYIGLSTYNIM